MKLLAQPCYFREHVGGPKHQGIAMFLGSFGSPVYIVTLSSRNVVGITLRNVDDIVDFGVDPRYIEQDIVNPIV